VHKRGKIAVWLWMALLTSVTQADVSQCRGSDDYFWRNYAHAKDPESFNLRWAECELQLGDTDAAIAAYERVLYYNDENEEAMEALIRLYKENGMDYEIGRVLNASDNRRLTPSQRQIVSSLLGEGQTSLLSTRISAAVTAGYDDNVNHSLTQIQNGIPLIQGKKGTAFHTLDLRFNLVHELEEIGGFSFQTNANFFWKDNYSAHFYDIVDGAFDMGIGYSAERYSFYLPFVYERMHYLDTDLYEEYGIRPRFTYLLRDDTLLNIGAKYLKHHYVDGISSNADRTLMGANVGLYRFFGDDYIYADIDYTDSDADSSNPLALTDYQYWMLTIGGSYEFSWNIIAKLDYRYGYGSYDNPPAAKRKDHFNQIHLGLEKEILPRLSVTADYIYGDNDCNFDTQSYSRQIVSVGIKYTY